MKKIIIPIIVIVILAGLILGGYFVIDSLFPKADPINVPSASSVGSMAVKKNENRNNGDLREIEDTDVDSILSKLSEAEPTRKMSVQDSPDAKTYYEIAVKTNERTHYFYVYFENGDCYVEIPYEGIYTVDKGLCNLLPTGNYRNDEKVKIGERFSVTGVGQQIKFVHPVTNAEHTLTVTDYEQDTMSFDRQFSDGYEHPTHLTKMAYTLEPELTNMQFSVSDTKQSDTPKKAKISAPNSDFASAIAIIGGADGPTSVIVGVPRTEKKLHAACSALTFEPQKKVEWKMTFREKTVEDFEIQIKE